ncbi:TPA: hypothetical protein ACF5XO_000690 [Legionella pneumophila]|nr:topoisomerase II [Legionella pneumophila]HBD7078786.1 hypothetical protein [Legionella pneumophila]HCC0691176.1 hypothetical protein [Legionella pneumophila]
MLDPKEVKEFEKTINEQLLQLQTPGFFEEFQKIWGKKLSLQSIHAHIGRHNNTYIDSVREQFLTKDDYIARWLSGLFAEIQRIEFERKQKYNGNIYQNTSMHFLLKAIQHPELKNYIMLFLERNFYRKYEERIRAKPMDELWSIWFGNNNLIWGILISPVFRNGEWMNDKSEIRKVKYQYWTIGHIMETGIVDPSLNEPYKFNSLEEFCKFYCSILSRLSNPVYEKKFMDLYIDYIKNSLNPLAEPFLIPELRYNKEHEHRFRLDFTILNPYSMSAIGFEISPASTHNAVKGVKTKKQIEINEELKDKWQKEMSKRNAYFLKYGINILTFTDDDLLNIEDCFDKMKKYLEQRLPSYNIKDELLKIKEYKFN